MQHKATVARIHQDTGQLCSAAAAAALPSSAIVPGVRTEGGAKARKNKPLPRTDVGPGIPSRASRTPPSTVWVVAAARGQGPAVAPLQDVPGPRKGRASPSPPDRTPAGRDSAYIPPRRPGWFPLRLRPNAPALARVRPPGLEGEPRPGRARSPRSRSPARPGAPHSLSGRLGTLSRRRRCASPPCNFISSSAAGHAHGARSPRTRMREGSSREGLPRRSAHARRRPSDRCGAVGRAASRWRLQEAPRLARRRRALISDHPRLLASVARPRSERRLAPTTTMATSRLH